MLNDRDLIKLEKLDVKDSKLIIHKKRIELSKKIKKITKYKIIKISPKEIDEFLAHDHLNLNWLEAVKTAIIINELKPRKAILDCPSPNKKAYHDYVKNLLKVNTELIAEHKADVNHKIVAAASILAKVAREEEIEKIKKKYGNFGPGYTSNEITQRFLKENFDKHPEIFRKSWIPYKNQVNKKKQKSLDEF